MQFLAAEHGDEPRQLRLEAVNGVGLAHACQPRSPAAGRPRPPRVRPDRDDELGATRPPRRPARWTAAEAEAVPPRPTRWLLCQNEAGHLQRLRHVSGKATVVLAGHDPVEAAVEGKTRLRAELIDDGVSGEVVVRVQPDGNRSRGRMDWKTAGRTPYEPGLALGSSRSSVDTARS